MSEKAKLTDRQRFWLKHIRACRERKQSLKAYALEHGFKVSALYEAKKKLKRLGVVEEARSGVRFVRVSGAAALRPSVSCRVLLVNGTVVELACGAEDFVALLQSAAALP